MNDSRCRDGVASVDGGGGRTPGGRDRAGACARGREDVWRRMVTTLAGLAFVVLSGGAGAQELDAPAAKPEDAGSAQPLSLRYRFTEKYGPGGQEDRPGLLGP